MKNRIGVKTTSKSSSHFGNCQVCGKYCSEVYHTFPKDGIYDFISKYGCKECISEK